MTITDNRYEFKKLLDGLADAIPTDYLCLDLETTGFTFSYQSQMNKDQYIGDLVVEVGTCDVSNHRADWFDADVLNWCGEHGIQDPWLVDKFDMCSHSMAKSGKTYHMNLPRMRQEGVDPIESLEKLRSKLAASIRDGTPIVGFNILSFDRRVIDDVFVEWLDCGLYIPDELIFDVGLLEKASQLKISPSTHESSVSFFQRVNAVRAKGVRWNLDACVKKYALASLYDLSPAETHSAGVDAMVSHLLLKEMLEI